MVCVFLLAVVPVRLWVLTGNLSRLLVWVSQILFQSLWRAIWEKTTTVRCIDSIYVYELGVSYVSKQYCALLEAIRFVVVVDTKFFKQDLILFG